MNDEMNISYIRHFNAKNSLNVYTWYMCTCISTYAAHLSVCIVTVVLISLLHTYVHCTGICHSQQFHRTANVGQENEGI